MVCITGGGFLSPAAAGSLTQMVVSGAARRDDVSSLQLRRETENPMSASVMVILNLAFATMVFGALTAVICLHVRLGKMPKSVSTSAERLNLELQQRAALLKAFPG